MKRKFSIILIAVLILIIACFSLIKNLTEKNNTKIDTYAGINLKIDKIFNPYSINGKSIKEIREYSNKQSVKWSKKPILFVNIKNTTISVNSRKIPVRIYTPKAGGNLPVIIYSHGLRRLDRLFLRLIRNLV